MDGRFNVTPVSDVHAQPDVTTSTVTPVTTVYSTNQPDPCCPPNSPVVDYPSNTPSAHRNFSIFPPPNQQHHHGHHHEHRPHHHSDCKIL